MCVCVLSEEQLRKRSLCLSVSVLLNISEAALPHASPASSSVLLSSSKSILHLKRVKSCFRNFDFLFPFFVCVFA